MYESEVGGGRRSRAVTHVPPYFLLTQAEGERSYHVFYQLTAAAAARGGATDGPEPADSALAECGSLSGPHG